LVVDRANKLGTVTHWSLMAVSASWPVLFLTLYVDMYWRCQFAALDNACYFGNHFIFGNYDNSAEVRPCT
jgi:hypothetical protein